MLEAKIKSLSLDRNASGKVSLQVIADIYNDSGQPVKFKLLDENGITLESSSTYVATPVQISKFFYLASSHFKKSNTKVTLEAEDTDGNKVSSVEYVDTFQLNNVERTDIDRFNWSIRNFSTTPIYSLVQILDSNNKVLYNSIENKKPYGTSYSYYNYYADSLLKNNPSGDYFFRIKYYSKDENWNRFYPDENGIQILVRNNQNPRVIIKDSKIRKEVNSFVLSSRMILSDFDEDDINYRVIDNLGTKLIDMPNFVYSPQLEHLSYEYPLVHFNSSRLTIKVEVNDKLYGHTTASETINLFSIYDFYRERDMFRWKFRNYSNKNITMQVEATDFKGNIIKIGNAISQRDCFDYIQLEDTTKFFLERDYYKYHLKVSCAEEGWTEYYPYKPFKEDGIQWTTYPHKNPTIEITESRIFRDLDDVKYLILNANVKDPENDQILFTVSDDTGKVIRKARDFIDTPAVISINQEYDIIDRTHVNITVAVEDDNGGTASATVLTTAYKITSLTQEKGHIFKWYIDNYSTQKLSMNIEILKENDEGVKDIHTVSNVYDVYSTIRSIKYEDRIIPKLPPGKYYYRLRVYSESEDWITYYPSEEGYEFEAFKNTPSVITLESMDLNKKDDNTFSVALNGNITDKDNDYVIYRSKDQLGNTLFDSETYKETPVYFSISKNYDIKDLKTPRLSIYIDSLDEGEAMTTLTQNINLFEIQNLYRDYNKFYWLFRNYTLIPIDMQVEILDHEGNLAGAGSLVTVTKQLEFREYREILNFGDYDEGNYFFRIRLSTPNETWTSYYPNINGLPFEIKENTAPKIKINSAKVVKDSSTKYHIDLNAYVTDKEGNKVYYVIKDNQ